MTKTEATPLGDHIYQKREERGLSTLKLAQQIGIHHSVLARIQLGEIRKPRQEVLAKIAKALDLSPVDLYALAGYETSNELPDIRGFLGVKYRALPTEDIIREDEI